jgi:hypothetical protein
VRNRFKSPNYRPDDGWYWYTDGEVELRDMTRYGITLKVASHLRAKGVRPPPDPFVLVMDCMCPHLPNGVCREPSAVKHVSMNEIKANTVKFFGRPAAAYDVISDRLSKCHTCAQHDRRFCPGCTGLPEWVSRGFGGARKPLPADLASGVCKLDCTLVSGAATPDDVTPFRLGEEAPDGCWRK